MERHAQEGSSGRWYVREGYKVVAGPYDEVLAKRLVATWNRRQARQAQQELPATMPVVRSTAPARQATRVARRRAQEPARRPEVAPEAQEPRLPASRFEQVLLEVPEEHRAVVGLHANLILNTTGGMRPSDAARQAVSAYARMGFEAFEEAHRAQSHSATAACARSGCSGCQSSLERSRRPQVDERLVHWYGELLMEHENDVEATWQELVELNEGWDGEPEAMAAARATFDRTIPHSLAQNAAIQWANRQRRPR